MSADPDAEIIIETLRIGGAMEVRAIAGDGLEVSFQAPALATEDEIERVARLKLAFVRSKRDGSNGGPEDDGSAAGRGGVVA